MKKPSLLPVLIACVLLLAAAGCSSSSGLGSGAAATVNGTDISTSELFDDLAVLANSSTYTSNLQQSGTQAYGEDGKTYTTQFVAGWLSVLIQNTLVEQQLASLGGSATDDEVSQARQNYTQLSQTGEIPQDFIDRLVQASANQTALQRVIEASAPPATVTDDEVRQYYDDNIDSIMQRVGGQVACAGHITAAYDASGQTTAPTPEQQATARQTIAQVQTRLRAGEDFATVAADVAQDPSGAVVGGDLGCVPQSSTQLPAEIVDAMYSLTIGQVSDPIETDVGVHLIFVRSRGVWPFDEAASAIRSQLEQDKGNVTQVEATRFLRDASIHVDPRFGTFDTAQAEVVPPEGPSTPSTTTASLDLLGGGGSGLDDGSVTRDSTP